MIIHQLKLSNEKNIFIKGSGYYTDEESNYNYWSKKIDVGYGNIQMTRVMRMKAMMDYKSKENYTKKLTESINTKCIIFANTQLQAERLCSYSYHSNNSKSEENLEKFKSGEISKLSTVLQLSEGVNIPNLKQGIIMHAYGNERKASQRIGRLLRLNPDDKSIVHILCYMDTIDQKWVTDALEGFDQSKILWKDFQINNY